MYSIRVHVIAMGITKLIEHIRVAVITSVKSQWLCFICHRYDTYANTYA